MAQWVKTLTTKPDNLSSMLRTLLASDLYMCYHIHMPTHPKAHKLGHK